MSGQKNQPNDYAYIRAWGNLMGSQGWYIEDQIRKARAAGAPPTAIYERYDNEHGSGPTGVWATFEEITGTGTQDLVQAKVDQIRGVAK